MADTAKFMVKIDGSPDLIDGLRDIVEANPALMKLESFGPSKEPSHLKLGLGEIATIVTVLNGLATLAKFAYAIYKHLNEKKAGQVTVQTPLRTVTILSSDAATQERIQELLESSLKA